MANDARLIQKLARHNKYRPYPTRRIRSHCLYLCSNKSSLRLVPRSAQNKADELCVNPTDSRGRGYVDTNFKKSRKYSEEIYGLMRKTPGSSLLKSLSNALASARTKSSQTLLQPLYLMSVGIGYLTKEDHQRRGKDWAKKETALIGENCTNGGWAAGCQDLRSDPHKNHCLGMCGPGCTCWGFICKDCCFHQGCKQHDLCCRHQALSPFCLTPFLFGFNCNGFGGYPKCLH